MTHLVTALVLVTTIVLAMTIGVVSGYLMIAGILNTFARKPQGTKPSPELAITQGITGD